MIHPPLDDLMKKVDSKYTLVVLSAKRAREIMSGETSSIETKSNKPVTISLEEIGSSMIGYERTKTGIK